LLGFINALWRVGLDLWRGCAAVHRRQRIGYLPGTTYYYKFLSTRELLRF